MSIRQEFVRIKNQEPLTLSCSAIADFLWEDFVRDARPIVKYLEDKYNIRQLCRFGKEVFDRLYTGDQVSWLISEEECEQYMRSVYNGESPRMPQGFRPENAFWWSIMGELSNAAAWPNLISICVGNQFNAGNNAVNIMNRLADEIEDIVAVAGIDLPGLAEKGDKLQELRDKFKEAQEKGDTEAAAKARQEGKALANEIMETVKQAAEQAQCKVDEIVDKSLQETKELNEDMGNLWGNEKGSRKDVGNLEEKRKLANKLKNNKNLKDVANRLGALRKVWAERKRAKKSKDLYSNIVGLKFSNDLTRAFATELALANTAEGRALFAVKYSQKTLLTKDYEAERKDLGKGPIIMYVDVSGSMRGSLEIWSKAITFVIAEEALKEKREVQINLFDTQITESVVLKPDRKNNAELIDLVGVWSLGGGTSFNNVLSHAGPSLAANKDADVLMITDGRAEVSDPWVKAVNNAKTSTGSQWTTLCLDMSQPPVCYRFSDEVYAVNTSKAAEAIDVIQKSLR